jgi:hypothetical protein
MSKERFNRIIYEAYDKYKTHTEQQQNNQKIAVQRLRSQGKRVKVVLIILLNKEEFIHKCKTDKEFSEMWGLKIEERELSWEERVQWVMKNTDVEWENLYIVEEINKESSPTKLITVEHNGEKIEVHE